ncbi:hypothetical protein UFOVP1276_31 [uncultured Caudovirales phage]|uniref:Uncharacterized protein n=1 Tax=uncultured Caudovirales phage TaxID=2100421 RepID=A0A6J5RRU0_9CAUD|nr:hypothetical protein UFOVP875_62 [uncultured Caudovirales phage]CAB4195075.1 hypothetical protein UFOVP1276_31 [uncultured Caudovirales phage]CAB4205163.1 hypothetical protein UFOVP1403_35 [uncultured Caudovirales phage]CAB5238076.1 hypothetical protein UFOVP1507_19 [uncultured Caudovirales phage]
MNTTPLQHPITEQDWDKDDAPTEGITEAYAWYQADVLAYKLDTLKYDLRRVITVLEERRRDNLRVIDDLLRENTALKAKLKEKSE